MTEKDIKNKLVSFAESVRGESMFDLSFNIKVSEFFRLKFENDKIEKQKICSSIYKYNI